MDLLGFVHSLKRTSATPRLFWERNLHFVWSPKSACRGVIKSHGTDATIQIISQKQPTASNVAICICFFCVFYRCLRKVRVGCDYTRIVEIFASTKSISKFQQFIFQDYDSTIWIPWFSMCFGDRFCPRSAASHPSTIFVSPGPGWVLPASPAWSVLHKMDRRSAGTGRNLEQRQRAMVILVIVLKRNAMRTSRDVCWLQRRGFSQVIWLVCVVYMVWDMIIFVFLWFEMTFGWFFGKEKLTMMRHCSS